MFALVKVVQKEKFQDKNFSQYFGLGKNKHFKIFRALTAYFVRATLILFLKLVYKCQNAYFCSNKNSENSFYPETFLSEQL